MTALSRFSSPTTSNNRDLYRTLSNVNTDFDVNDPKYIYLNVDSFQYQFLSAYYELDVDLKDPSVNYYNVILSKKHFTV